MFAVLNLSSLIQDLLAMEDKKTHRLGSSFKVNFGALVWDVGVRPSHQAVILPGTSCSAAMPENFSKGVLVVHNEQS